MKRIVVTIVVSVMALAALAQQTDKAPAEPTDTIILISGRKVVANIQSLTTSKVVYIPYDGKYIKSYTGMVVLNLLTALLLK